LTHLYILIEDKSEKNNSGLVQLFPLIVDES